MIALKRFAQFLENNLNSLGMGEFKIFCDLGDYQNAVRTGNTVTRFKNGVLEMSSNDITPIKNWISAVTSCTLSIAIDVDLQERNAESGGYYEVEETREALNKLVALKNGQTETFIDVEENDSQVTYEVTSYFGSAVVGAVEQASPIGKMVEITLDCFFTYVQNGMNSNDTSISIDSEEIAFVSGEITRVKTAQASQYANDKHLNTTNQQNGISIDLRLPYFDSPSGNAIWDDILDCEEQNKGHLVTISNKNGKRQYFMIFGQNGATLQASKNITLGINLVEGKPELMPNIGAPMIFEVNAPSNDARLDIGRLGTSSIDDTVSGFVDWGDGNGIELLERNHNKNASGQVEITDTVHKYANAGNYVVKLWGNLKDFYPGLTTGNAKITQISQWGTLTFKSLTFRECEELTSIPWGEPMPQFGARGITGSDSKEKALEFLFENCTSLTYSLESNGSCERLFENHSDARFLSATFRNTAIAETPFGIYASLPKVEYLTSTYEGCQNLNKIYSDFSQSIIYAESAFAGCGTAVTNGISVYESWVLPNLEDATSIFSEAKLAQVSKVFASCSKLVNVSHAFGNVVWVGDNNISDDIFGDRSTLSGIYPSPKLERVMSVFSNTIASPTGTAPSLWLTSWQPNITQYTNAFYGCTALSNYAEIPNGWK